MWLVLLALRRPYTFVVRRHPDAGVRHRGDRPDADRHLPGDRRPGRVDGVDLRRTARRRRWSSASSPSPSACTRATSTTSSTSSAQSLNGLSVIKVYFQPDADVQAAMAQVTASSQRIPRSMPPGISPPFIVRYNATDVPILQLASPARSAPKRSSATTGRISSASRSARCTAPRAAGVRRRQRQVNVDLDPQALYAQGVVARRREPARSTRRTSPCRRARRRSANARVLRAPEQSTDRATSSTTSPFAR